jgi:hypothetical protein
LVNDVHGRVAACGATFWIYLSREKNGREISYRHEEKRGQEARNQTNEARQVLQSKRKQDVKKRRPEERILTMESLLCNKDEDTAALEDPFSFHLPSNRENCAASRYDEVDCCQVGRTTTLFIVAKGVSSVLLKGPGLFPILVHDMLEAKS